MIEWVLLVVANSLDDVCESGLPVDLVEFGSFDS